MEALNQSLFLLLNATPATPTWKLHLAAVLANDFIYLIPILLVSLWLWSGTEQRSLALKAGTVTAIALGINLVIGLVWPHPRPFMVGIGHTFIQHAAEEIVHSTIEIHYSA